MPHFRVYCCLGNEEGLILPRKWSCGKSRWRGVASQSQAVDTRCKFWSDFGILSSLEEAHPGRLRLSSLSGRSWWSPFMKSSGNCVNNPAIEKSFLASFLSRTKETNIDISLFLSLTFLYSVIAAFPSEERPSNFKLCGLILRIPCLNIHPVALESIGTRSSMDVQSKMLASHSVIPNSVFTSSPPSVMAWQFSCLCLDTWKSRSMTLKLCPWTWSPAWVS